MILTVKQNNCVKRKNNICLKPVPGNQIVVSVKIKIATAQSPFNPPKHPPPCPPTHKKKARAGNLSSKKKFCRGGDREKNSCKLAEKFQPTPNTFLMVRP